MEKAHRNQCNTRQNSLLVSMARERKREREEEGKEGGRLDSLFSQSD